MHVGNVTLREYQQHLFARLHATASAEAPSSYLKFAAGEWTWVVLLNDISAVVPAPKIVPVPLTETWLSGIANVRGSLLTVTDFGRFMNAQPTAVTPDSRLIVLHERYRVHAALLVRRSLGLHQAKVSVQGKQTAVFWTSATNVGSEEGICRELNVRDLVRDPRFLHIALL